MNEPLARPAALSDFGPDLGPDFGAGFDPLLDPSETPAAPIVSPAELAAMLAARMCHDFISPASAIVSGVDLLDDPTAADMKDDSLNLIGASARKLVALLAFSRVAFGASATADTFDTRELHKLAEGVFAHVRAELDWAVEAPALNKPAARALLNLAQLALGALPSGGVARLTAVERDGAFLIAAEATSPKARLKPEIAAGLKGQPLDDGLAGHWVQAYYLHELLTAAGGGVEAAVTEGRVVLRARAPA